MAEFIGGNEKYISAREPIVFENKTESKYEVCAGIVFHKSGIYEVSVVGNKTIVSEMSKRKTGKWYKPIGVMPPEYAGVYRCSECDEIAMRDWKHHKQILSNFCPNCGADMRG